MTLRLRSGQVLVAHRGDPAHAPENTLASIRSAVNRGARAVEVDVRRTADGVWVVFHDAKLRRIAGVSGSVARSPWSWLRRLEAGSWFSPRFKGEPIPRLAEVLEFCRRRRVGLFLDVKVSKGEASLCRLLRRFDRSLERVWVGAGTLPSLRRWRRLLGEEVPLFGVSGYRVSLTKRRIDQARRLKLKGLAVYKRWATPTSIRRARQAGLQLFVWTLRRPAELRRFAKLGVDGMMSEVW